jgi:succinate-semialdehyde dehydrogenase/glutarate-semialdehyde dehydrogenase
MINRNTWKEPAVAERNTVSVEREAELLAAVPTGLLIGGLWREASDKGTFDVESSTP